MSSDKSGNRKPDSQNKKNNNGRAKKIAWWEKRIKESSCSLVNSDPARLTDFVKPQSETRL